jgi:uncharacterized membrane-anchored protein YitT (DUF2179 family)
MTAIQIRDVAIEIVYLFLSILLASIGLKAFLLPNGFLDGGATGIAILLNKVFSFDISLSLPIISIPFFVISASVLSRRILVKSIISIIGLALVLYFENFEPITEDKLIIATFGGIFLGCGIGLAIRNGAVLDGSEVLGVYLHNKFGVSIGNIILAFNLILFAITAILVSTEVAMYSTLTYIVTGKAIDFTIHGFENYVGLMIVSSKSLEIQNSLLEKIGQGITVYQGRKGYGKNGFNEHREIIHLVVNRIDVKRIHQIIDEVDAEAFSAEFEVNHVKGGKVRKFFRD